jgi:hypothetical protein
MGRCLKKLEGMLRRKIPEEEDGEKIEEVDIRFPFLIASRISWNSRRGTYCKLKS